MKIFRKPKIGLALGGGGPKGFALIGVLKKLEENNIPIDFISGTSVGAIVGGLYAKFGEAEKVEKLAQKMNFSKFLPIISDVSISNGVVKGEKLIKYIDEITGEAQIEDLKIPFCAVTTDILTGKTVIFRKGPLSLALRASCSVPVLFSTMKYKDYQLVDGGLTHPIPIQAVKKLGANRVIAVNLMHHDLPKEKKEMNKTEVFNAMFDVMNSRLSKEECKEADIVITPQLRDVGNLEFKEFSNYEDICERGEKATEEKIGEIKRLVNRKILGL